MKYFHLHMRYSNELLPYSLILHVPVLANISPVVVQKEKAMHSKILVPCIRVMSKLFAATDQLSKQDEICSWKTSILVKSDHFYFVGGAEIFYKSIIKYSCTTCGSYGRQCSY